MRKVLLLILALMVMTGCSNDDEANSDLRIRLSNVSSFDFKNITVNTSIENVCFDDLAAGQTSDYKTFQLAYRYAFIELEINGKVYTIQPVDYVGETQLESGDYTYQLNANDSEERYGKLSINLVEE